MHVLRDETPHGWARTVRRYVVPALVVDVLIVVPTNAILCMAENHYLDGLVVPFPSKEASRYGASFWLFAGGMTVAMVLLVTIGFMSQRWMHHAVAAMQVKDSDACNRTWCIGFERMGRVMQISFCVSGFFFALMAWSNHMYFHLHKLMIINKLTTVAAYAGVVVGLTINVFMTSKLVQLDAKGACPGAPPELCRTLRRSKRLKAAMNIIINISMAMHVPTTYIYEWFCGDRGGLPPNGAVYYSVQACEDELGRSAAYCESWRDPSNATMTMHYRPPDDVCPSVALSAYNAATQYVSVIVLTMFILTLQSDFSYEPPAAARQIRPIGAGGLGGTSTASADKGDGGDYDSREHRTSSCELTPVAGYL